MTREEFGEQCVKAGIAKKAVLLKLATGFGKSKIAIQIANRRKANSVLIVVPQSKMKKNWADEIKKWSLKAENVKMVCYASLKTCRNIHYDLIIIDEAHHVVAPKYRQYLRNVQVDCYVCLSATITESQEEILRQTIGELDKHEFTLPKAIKEEILPDPEIFIIPLKLSNEKKCVITQSWGRKDAAIAQEFASVAAMKKARFSNQAKYANINGYVKCSAQEKYDYYCAEIDKAIEHNKSEYAKIIGTQRKAFIGMQKTAVAKALVTMMRAKKRRFITFCASIEQADMLGGEHAVHSKAFKTNKTVQNFQNGVINELFVKNMMRECMNLNNIECGILVQFDSKEGNTVQCIGRILRSKKPQIFIPYFVDTMEEKWLQRALEGIPDASIHKVSLQYIVESES